MFRGLVFLILLELIFPALSYAQNSNFQRILETRDKLNSGIFDPANLPFDGEETLLTARYTGDDYGWPVWSMAIVRSCAPRSYPCAQDRLKIRTIRAFPIKTDGRPRNKGSSLTSQINTFIMQGESIESAISKSNIAWDFVDIDSCPAAKTLFETAPDQKWVSDDIFERRIIPYLHADSVEVKLYSARAIILYKDIPTGDQPSAWASALMEAAIPCLTQSYMTPPWER